MHIGGDTKSKAFAQKVGKILANRYPQVIDEHLEGFLTAEDPDVFLDHAAGAIMHDLWKVMRETTMEAIAIRQGGGEE